MERKLRVGEFLVQNDIITREQLSESLLLQRDNPGRMIGEILVTQGALTKEEIVMALEAYIMTNDVADIHVDEWLDQEEIDMLIEKMREQEQAQKKNAPETPV